MILRLWRGWTTSEKAARYEELIATAIFPGIAARAIAGLDGLELFRRPIESEVEFMTLMRFKSWEAVRISPVRTGRSRSCRQRRAALDRFDEKAAHYESRVARPVND
jgi:hypothetical protein